MLLLHIGRLDSKELSGYSYQNPKSYERGFVYNSKYEVPDEPEMEELLKANITTNKLVGFCDAAHANDLRN